jgi:hypothetical protein
LCEYWQMILMHMKKTIMIGLLLVFPLCMQAQILEGETQEKDVKEMSTPERIFVGGFLGLQFGSFTAINVNLHGGYRITNRLSAGLGGMYQYSNDRWFNQSVVSHVYGGSVFARFRVVYQAFIHAEHEWLSVQSRGYLGEGLPGTGFQFLPGENGTFDPDNRTRSTEKNILLGPGYSFRVGPRVTLNILALYNFNTSSAVYFDNPFFRAGIDVSLR